MTKPESISTVWTHSEENSLRILVHQHRLLGRYKWKAITECYNERQQEKRTRRALRRKWKIVCTNRTVPSNEPATKFWTNSTTMTDNKNGTTTTDDAENEFTDDTGSEFTDDTESVSADDAESETTAGSDSESAANLHTELDHCIKHRHLEILKPSSTPKYFTSANQRLMVMVVRHMLHGVIPVEDLYFPRP